MACTFLQFIFISPSSTESIKIKFYRSTGIIILMYHFENLYHITRQSRSISPTRTALSSKPAARRGCGRLSRGCGSARRPAPLRTRHTNHLNAGNNRHVRYVPLCSEQRVTNSAQLRNCRLQKQQRRTRGHGGRGAMTKWLVFNGNIVSCQMSRATNRDISAIC